MEKSRIQLGGLHLILFPLCLQDETRRAVAVAPRGSAPQCPSPWPHAHCRSPEHAMGMLVPT